MIVRRLPGITTIVGLLISQVCLSAEKADELRLTLPPKAYAVAGAEMNVYFENLVVTEQPEELAFEVKSDFGKADKMHWTVTPSAADVGTHDWQVTVSQGGKPIAKGTMTWVVSPAKVKADGEISLLIIGDSLTHATIYPNDIGKRLTECGVTKWNMLGTHRPSNAAPGVGHEGYGGWRWETFLTMFDPKPDPDKTKRKSSSPFLFLVDDKPKLDIGRYLKEFCDGTRPDFVIFKLGINDAFGFAANDLQKMDQQIDGIFRHAETLLTAFREAAPHAELGICLTTPGNFREEAFQNNYNGSYPRWGWKRIQHRLVERQIKHFSGRENEHIRIIPTELNLDPIDGYPADNSVHPNETGYKQIAASIHAWLMSRLSSPK